ncbi:MAG: DUF386 domain-containing protein [Hungatella sp.]|nr:DUF386 domain-containing protein [Hungatella sp.]
MIFDLAANLDFYRNLGIEGRYAKAVDFLKSHDLKTLPNGKYEIDGKNVYANVMDYNTVPWEEASYEAHRDYTDIQYIIEGCEVMTYAPVSQLTATGPYNEEKDVIKFDDSVAGLRAAVHSGEFMIFNPWDGHKPKAADGKPGYVKKIVVKIKENESQI